MLHFVRILLVAPALFVAGFLSVVAVWDRYDLYREYQIAASGIGHMDRLPEGGEIPLAEYLKARAYHYAARVKGDVVWQKHDQGEVDSSLLRGIPISTGKVDSSSDYEAFKKKIAR